MLLARYQRDANIGRPFRTMRQSPVNNAGAIILT